ncbi:MAG: outer membrane protein transport protein [Tannerella sp.]|jgi:long-subunit fatty acid transport protein|nr:outer membrane protein transport protein [Tannerella sp.]
MKKTGIYIGTLLLSCGMLFAQGEMDAYRYSQTDLNGTARSMSMGGAFGALGGDMSAMSHNPAGLGVYRSSEVQATVALSNVHASATWTGIKNSENQTRLAFDNFSYITYFPTGKESGIKGWNLGIAYNKVKDFGRNIKSTGNPGTSIGDFIAMRTTREGVYLNDLFSDDSYSPYNNPNLSWLSILGHESGYITPQEDVAKNTVYRSSFSSAPQRTVFSMTERNSIIEYDFSLATNISDRVFLGATLGITDLDYRISSRLDETFAGEDYGYIDNNLESEGVAYSVNLGVIVRPIDALRVGISYNSPKWYSLTDYFYATGETYVSNYVSKPKMEAKTPLGQYAEYRLRTPDRWIFSAAGVIGNTALVSLDYELTNYKSMYLSDRQGYGYGDNKDIREDFGLGHTVKLGAEVKLTPQFALRAGYIWQPSPMKNLLRNGGQEVFPVGTVSHFTLSNATSYYTAGLGYRFTPNFYMDMAYILRSQNEMLYPFSNIYAENGTTELKIGPSDLSIITSRIALTFGYKF